MSLRRESSELQRREAAKSSGFRRHGIRHGQRVLRRPPKESQNRP
jgi:hypothetical protein